MVDDFRNQSNTMIVIYDLNKEDLLRELWMAQIMPDTPGEHFIQQTMTMFYDPKEAKEALNGRIITFCHKHMKVDLRGSLANPYHYDRIAGKGTFERVIRKLRQKK